MHPSLQTRKFEIMLHSFLKSEGKLNAVRVLSSVTGMSINQANWFVDQLPQPLSTPLPESFRSAVLTKEECDNLKIVLSSAFDYTISEAGQPVLPFGARMTSPWIHDSPMYGASPKFCYECYAELVNGTCPTKMCKGY